MFNWFFKDKFLVEKALLAGHHRTYSQRPSVLHFSFNKAATQTVKKLLIECARRNKLTPALLHDYAFHHSMPFLDHLDSASMKKYAHLFKSSGYLYTVFGGMIEEIPSLEKFKVVLVVRDPRDILVSDYYSIAYSHAIPDGEKKEVYLSRREKALATKLDEYVLQSAPKLQSVFERYAIHLFPVCPGVHVARYEDMVENFPEWLDSLVSACGMEISKSFRQDLLANHEARRPKGENIQKHLRKGMPGEHREKLRSETIEQLNQTFNESLTRFNYLS
jgi:hypothetical protein